MTQVYTCSWTKAVHSLKYLSFVMLLGDQAVDAPKYGRQSDICFWNRIGLNLTSLWWFNFQNSDQMQNTCRYLSNLVILIIVQSQQALINKENECLGMCITIFFFLEWFTETIKL